MFYILFTSFFLDLMAVDDEFSQMTKSSDEVEDPPLSA